MDIVKNTRDLSLNEDEQFFADIINEEFGCDTYLEKITNVDFVQHYARPLNDFNIYTTAQPSAEGMRMLGWRRRAQIFYNNFIKKHLLLQEVFFTFIYH